jgi:signal transduction histidine kinase
VYEILQTYQGTIAASSQVGAGTVFRLHFPSVEYTITEFGV